MSSHAAVAQKGNIIICPGSINPDFVIRSGKPFRLINRTTTFIGHSSIYAGGKGRNQAVAAKKASGPSVTVTLVSAVGNDLFGRHSIDLLKKEGIETKYIAQKNYVETGKCILSIHQGGYQIVGLDLAANLALTHRDIDRAMPALRRAAVLVAQIENGKENTAYALALAKRFHCMTILNPSVVPNDTGYVTKHIFPYTDVLVLNVQEAEDLLYRRVDTRLGSITRAAKRLAAYGIPVVIVTMGDKGSLIYHSGDNTFKHIKAIKVKEVDTTACGDVFVGALAAAINVHRDRSNINFVPMGRCIQFATAAAALAVTKIGASESAPMKREIVRLMRKDVL